MFWKMSQPTYCLLILPQHYHAKFQKNLLSGSLNIYNMHPRRDIFQKSHLIHFYLLMIPYHHAKLKKNCYVDLKICSFGPNIGAKWSTCSSSDVFWKFHTYTLTIISNFIYPAINPNFMSYIDIMIAVEVKME